MEKAVKKCSRILALLIGAVFVYAGVNKLVDLNKFASDVYAFRLLPWNGAVAVAFYLPWLEVLCGVALQWQRMYAGALLILMTMTGGFMATVASAIARGLDVSCGCFGRQSAEGLWVTLMLDAALLAGLGALWWMRRRGNIESASDQMR